MLIDWYLAKKGGQIATLLAMMMDFVPESIALGAILGFLVGIIGEKII